MLGAITESKFCKKRKLNSIKKMDRVSQKNFAPFVFRCGAAVDYIISVFT